MPTFNINKISKKEMRRDGHSLSGGDVINFKL